MKHGKRLLCGCLIAVGMAFGVYAWNAQDSFVTLSYFTQQFIPNTVGQGETAVNDRLQGTYDQKKQELDQLQQGYVLQASDGGQQKYSAELRPAVWTAGDELTVSTGSGILLFSGAAKLEHNGTVVDVTTGEEVASGSALLANHRYVVAEETMATVTVQQPETQLGIQGGYSCRTGVPFVDVATESWYYDSVRYVYENGLFSGVGDNKFEPDNSMTRAMLMTVLYRVAGSPQAEMDAAKATFLDVPEGEWYTPFVRWGAEQSLTAGTGDGMFSPNLAVTREQVVVMLYSFGSKYLGKTLEGHGNLSGYSDLDQASDWALDALAWAEGIGLLKDSTSEPTLLNAGRSATRAEVAAMLRSFAEKIS